MAVPDRRQQDAERLLVAARNGDRASADALLNEFRPLIAGYVKKRTRSLDDAEDLTQNVFLRASRNLGNFRGDCPFSQWLLRIAANELKNYYERTLPTRPSTAPEDFDWENALGPQQPEASSGPYSEAEDRNLVQHLVGMAREVCNNDEFSVLMMVYQGESFESIADLLSMKGATVRSHFLRARGRLLSHIVVTEPNLLGGDHTIRSAVQSARRDGIIDDREAGVFDKFDPRSEMCRAACLKVAKYLPIPLALMLLGGLWKS